MSTYLADYQADLGRDFYAVSLVTRFRVAEGVEQVPDEAGLLPASFLGWVRPGPGPCSLPIVPRRALIYLSDLLQFELPIPFRGGTAQFSQIMTEILALPGVRAYDLLPEMNKPSQVILQVR